MKQLIHLEQFGFLTITGRDAQKFLQGYTTCDLVDVTTDVSGIGAICNLQGRMVTGFRVVRTDEGFLLRMAVELVPVAMAFLQKYIVFSKAAMTDVSDSVHCYGIIGEVDDYPTPARAVAHRDQAHILRLTDSPARYEVWCASPPSIEGAEAASMEAWARAEIEDGIVWVTGKTSGEYLPQMLDYHRIGGVDFDKGCYLGQEIVARMQYRGKVNRKLFRVRDHALSTGDALLQDDRQVGEVVAAAGDAALVVVQSKGEEPPAVTDPNGKPLSLELIQR